MWNLQYIIFIWRQRYCQIFESALVYLQSVLWKFALHTSCCLWSQWKWPIYRAWLVEYKVQLAPFAINAIKKSKWSFSLRDRYRCKYVFVEFEQVFATWSYTKKVSKFWKISNLIVLGSFTYVEKGSEVVYLKKIC